MSSVNDQVIPIYAGWIGSWQISVGRRPLGELELAKRYDRVATKWARLTERLGYPHSYEQLWKQFLREVDLTPAAQPAQVLDCGVGTGSFALAFARAWNEPVRLDAIDVSDSMIRQARRRLNQVALDVTCEIADVRRLPYADNQYDLVMAAHVLEHLPDPVAALEEVQRVLKPGGWLVLCLTRESALGRYLQVKWRTHRLNAERGESWLDAAGLNAHRMKLISTGWFRQTSLTCIGRKPAYS